jgi:hypothetical protein
MRASAVSICCVLLAAPAQARADTSPNAVTDWELIVQQAIHNANAPRPPAGALVLHAMAVLAMYDAVVAIEGGYQPYAAAIRAWPGADVRAAVATAAYLTARARVASSQIGYLDQQYSAYVAAIRDGQTKIDGIRVGRKAASAMLTLRANDGFDNIVLYQCSSNPPPAGEFEPNTGCPTAPTNPQPIDAKLAQVRPFTFRSPSRFRPDGPDRSASKRYTRDFTEVRDYGRSDSAFRSPEQTDIAYFWSENAYVHWNRNLISLAVNHDLSLPETARLFAMVHTAAADALIAGFEAKYFYAYWRPRTAIPRADTDRNPDTHADPTWTPLLQVNHPEYPSAHAFLSTAVTDAVSAFFETNRITWTIVTSKSAVPQLVQVERTYHNLDAITREVDDARVWSGLHWRHSMRDGDRIGRDVARHVVKHYFRPTR